MSPGPRVHPPAAPPGRPQQPPSHARPDAVRRTPGARVPGRLHHALASDETRQPTASAVSLSLLGDEQERASRYVREGSFLDCDPYLAQPEQRCRAAMCADSRDVIPALGRDRSTSYGLGGALAARLSSQSRNSALLGASDDGARGTRTPDLLRAMHLGRARVAREWRSASPRSVVLGLVGDGVAASV